MDFNKKLIEYKQEVFSLINSYLNSLEESVYKELFVYNLSDSGKLIRPIIVTIFENAFSLGKFKLDSFKVALEMVHVSSLIHDDLPGIDNDLSRRGRPSAHVKFGQGNAILGGDLMFSRALTIVSEDQNLSDKEKVILLQTLIHAQNDLCEGQILDLDLREKVLANKISYENDSQTALLLDTLNMKKTGALFVAAAMGPARILGLKNKELAFFSEIMTNLSKIFQLRDDILDSKHDSRDENNIEINYLNIFGEEVVLNTIESLFQSTISIIKDSKYNLSLLEDLLRYLLNRSE